MKSIRLFGGEKFEERELEAFAKDITRINFAFVLFYFFKKRKFQLNFIEQRIVHCNLLCKIKNGFVVPLCCFFSWNIGFGCLINFYDLANPYVGS